jgi:hypothetical protein
LSLLNSLASAGRCEITGRRYSFVRNPGLEAKSSTAAVTLTSLYRENQNLLTTKLPNRPVATGFEVDLFAPTINAVFPDEASHTGVLPKDNKILWSNGTTWIRDHHTGNLPAPGSDRKTT